MSRDKLVKEYEKETGNKFNVECVVYNDYAEWLETKLSERQEITKANAPVETKPLIIGDVIQRSELVCMCKGTTQVNRINDKYICCTCNRPLM